MSTAEQPHLLCFSATGDTVPPPHDPPHLVLRRRASRAPRLPSSHTSIDRSPVSGREPDDVSAALEAIIQRFGTMMYAIGREYRLPDEDIDEAIQEVRIRLWRTLVTSQELRRVPASYIYRAASSAMLDLIRRRRARREQAVESIDARPLTLAATLPGPDARLATDDVTRAVAESIERLPASRRGVVRMYLAGYSREQIAQLMRWSEPKTRNLLYRGLADLRAALEARGIHPGEEP